MSTPYDAAAIEVLAGLDPVRKRPGMYTDTSRPNHLAHEVIDNAVDEAIAGHCTRLDVTLYQDSSLAVTDNGRGMPVDRHPVEKVSGVEVILTRLHAGGKFSGKTYSFSGGLHGVGVSVVNALSGKLVVTVRRGGREYEMEFAHGNKVRELKETGTTKARGTTVRFWPESRYFDSARFHVPRLKHILEAKAVMCPGLHVSFTHESDAADNAEWCYAQGLVDYLRAATGTSPRLPEEPVTGHFRGNDEEVDFVVTWLPEGGDPVGESYVNLIPTPEGGTHVNGLRSGITESLREFCEFRCLLPRGVKLAPEDVWASAAFILSFKMRDPQFSGQTKDRLTSRDAAAFVGGVVRDAFGDWLAQHVAEGERIAQLAIESALARVRAERKVERKKLVSGPALPGKLSDCSSEDLSRTELFLVEGDSAGGSAKQARSREFQAILPLRGKILNTWEVEPSEVLASQEVHDIAVALGVDPGSSDLSGLRYGKVCILADADSDGAHIATLLCALFVRHFRPLTEAGRVYVAMPPLYRIDVGQEVYYALDEQERKGVLDRIAAEKPRAKPGVTRFKGLGEMNPLQLRETTMAPDTRRLVRLDYAAGDNSHAILDMMLARKRAADRKAWLEAKGNQAESDSQAEPSQAGISQAGSGA